MDELKRHKLIFKIVQPIAKLIFCLRFNYKYDDLRKIPEPYLLLANHNFNLDPCFVGIATKHQIYFVASETVARAGFFSRLLMWAFKPILHKKGRAGISSTKEVLKTVKSGSSVCIFAEGNRSYNGLTGPIPEATGKLAKRTGASLVTFRIEGGYLSHPRWAVTKRRGRMYGRLVRVYTPEELKSMTDDQVNEAIRSDLFEDAYATQEKQMIKYRGRRLAYGLEAALFECPACRKFNTITSTPKRIACTCGFSAEYDVYGYLNGSDGIRRTVTEWDVMQRADLKERFADHAASGEPVFSDEVVSTFINADHSPGKKTEGTLTAYTDRVEFAGTVYPLDEIKGMALFVRNTIIAHIGEDMIQYNIKGAENFCALKYLYLYNLAKGES